MDTLTRARQEIDTLLAQLRLDLDAHASQRLADLTRREADLDRREAELAHAAELVSADAAVQSAWRQCRAENCRWFQQLIDQQLEHLAPASPTRTVLHTLSRMVEQADA
jgi:hypothetical protein